MYITILNVYNSEITTNYMYVSNKRDLTLEIDLK